MAYTVPDLPYGYDALEPYIDEQTMRLHHDKHHNAYVSKLNAAVEGHPDQASKSLEDLIKGVADLPDSIRTAVRNNGGGAINHNLFWEIMAPDAGGAPSGDLGTAIDSELGGFDKFKDDFSKAAATQFGSGWAWLVVDSGGKLLVSSTPNQDNPLMKGVADKNGTPILGLDVWEHAYYLNYQNRRPDYIEAWWSVVNWKKVEALYEAAVR